VVIGERFAWAHIPKTGGDATVAMLEAVPGLVLFADSRHSNDKHLPFSNREEQVRGKLLVMNIRRLPAWVLSAAHHKAQSGLHPDYKPLPMPSVEEMADDPDPGRMLRWMTDGGRFEIDRWLRTEHLADDVITLLDQLGALDDEVAGRVRAVGRRNASDYDHDPAAHFSAEQIERIYARNPDWAEVERAAFGDLLCEV
jgi:hypothetical protein